MSDRNIVAIFSDIMMPNLDGMSLFKRVKALEIYDEVPFVFITALDTVETIYKAMDLGARGYIVKPITVDQVEEKLRHLFPPY